MDMIERLWEHSIIVLKQAEKIKHEHYLSKEPMTPEQWRAQGVADTLRGLLILMREDGEFAQAHEQEWREGPSLGANSSRSVEIVHLCPIDRSILAFQFQTIRRQRFKCTDPTWGHVWDLDFRGVWVNDDDTAADYPGR